jgi:hypothetical protein
MAELDKPMNTEQETKRVEDEPIEEKQPCCNDRCRKDWAIIVCCFIVLYAFDALFFWALLEAVMDDSILCLIMFFVVFVISASIIIGMITWGYCTNALEKIKAEDYNENVASEDTHNDNKLEAYKKESQRRSESFKNTGQYTGVVAPENPSPKAGTKEAPAEPTPGAPPATTPAPGKEEVLPE